VPGLGEPPPVLKRSGATAVFRFEVCCDCAAEPAGPDAAPSFGGSGLFRKSLSVVLEDDGVTAGDCAAFCELDCEGDDVPSFDSLFLDLDLLGSFVRESCSC
jgi:hypothetical protein